MSAVSLLFQSTITKIGAVRAGIGVIELDCTLSAAHSSKVDATKHPVERGAKITDHLRPEPDVVTIDGLVSDTPVSRTQQTRAVQAVGGTLTSSATSSSLSGTPGYAKEALAKLLAIKDGGILVTLATELRTYTDMAITSLQIPRDATIGESLRFTAVFEKIVIVENKVTQLRPATDPRANKLVKRGRTVLGNVQHASKLIRKTVAPWKKPGYLGDQAKALSDRFKFIGPILGVT